MPGLSCGMRDLGPWSGMEPGPLRWERGVLATGPLGKSLYFVFLRTLKLLCMWVLLKDGRLSYFHHGAHWHVYCLSVSQSPCQWAARLNSKTDFSGGRDFYPRLIVKSMWAWVFGEMVYDTIWQVCCRSQDAGCLPATQPASMTVSSVFYLVYMRCFLLATSSSELPAEGWQFCCLSHMEKQVAFVQRLSFSLPPLLLLVTTLLEPSLSYFTPDEFPKLCPQLAVKCPAASLQGMQVGLPPSPPPKLHVYPSSPWFPEESNIWHSGQAWRKWLSQLKVAWISVCFLMLLLKINV